MRPPTASRPQVLTLAPAHALRVGPGLDAVEVRARGHGLVLVAGRVLPVWGHARRLVLRRFPGPGVKALFLGLQGLARAEAELAPAARAEAPRAPSVQPPPAPPAPAVPALTFDFTPQPPQVP